MSDHLEPPPKEDARPRAGLCGSCGHQRLIRNTRGSEFSMCGRSASDPRFPRYPPLPVISCDGYEPRAEGAEAPLGPR